MDGSNLLNTLRDLYDCLEKEQQALIGSDYINLEKFIQNKAILLDSLENCRKGLSNATRDEKAYFKKIEILNMINQRIAARLQTNLGELMHILRGNIATPALYNATGKKEKLKAAYKSLGEDYAKA